MLISNFVGRRESMSVSPTPHVFELAKDDEREPMAENTGPEQFSAADYDPSQDRREDERKRFGDMNQPIEITDNQEEEEDEEDEEEDVDDIFAVALSDKKKKKKKSVVVRSLSLTFHFPVG